MIELLFAVLAGILTIAAPCTLPMLPILLGASIGRTSHVRPAMIALGLCALTAVIYAPVHRYGFITYDDPYYIYDNPHVQTGFTRENIHYALTTNTGGNWNPLLWLSFCADRALPSPPFPRRRVREVPACAVYAWPICAPSKKSTVSPRAVSSRTARPSSSPVIVRSTRTAPVGSTDNVT